MMDPLMSPQRATRVIPFRVSSAGAVLEGSQHITVTKGATGIYSITLLVASARVPVMMGLTGSTVGVAKYGTASVTGFANILFESDAGTDTDTEFHGCIMAFDAADER